MSIQSVIEAKLADNIVAEHVEIINESDDHNVPPGSESHFKVILVSKDFEGKSLLQRHRMVNNILEEELAHKIHALALHTYTLPEWSARQDTAPLSPPCLGDSEEAGH